MKMNRLLVHNVDKYQKGFGNLKKWAVGLECDSHFGCDRSRVQIPAQPSWPIWASQAALVAGSPAVQEVEEMQFLSLELSQIQKDYRLSENTLFSFI